MPAGGAVRTAQEFTPPGDGERFAWPGSTAVITHTLSWPDATLPSPLRAASTV